jgi:hypothetical protein
MSASPFRTRSHFPWAGARFLCYLAGCMSKAMKIAVLAMFGGAVAYAGGSPCPVMLVSGTGDETAIVVTFRNVGKLPIRQLEFNCTPAGTEARKGQRARCREANALFYPGMEYTVRYPYPGGVRRAVVVTVKSVTVSEGYVFKPSKRQPCRTLRITPRRTTK